MLTKVTLFAFLSKSRNLQVQSTIVQFQSIFTFKTMPSVNCKPKVKWYLLPSLVDNTDNYCTRAVNPGQF